MVMFLNDIRKVSFKSDIRLDMKMRECETCNEKKIMIFYKKLWKNVVYFDKNIDIDIEDNKGMLLILNDYRAFLYEKKIDDNIKIT